MEPSLYKNISSEPLAANITIFIWALSNSHFWSSGFQLYNCANLDICHFSSSSYGTNISKILALLTIYVNFYTKSERFLSRVASHAYHMD